MSEVKIITPPVYLERVYGPLIFLAGPILGAQDWQSQAMRIIARGHIVGEGSAIYLASPRREFEKGDFSDKMHAEQVDWETHHLKKAAEYGSIMFWLAKEVQHRCDRAYAQTTRFELGEWKIRHKKDKTRIVIGIEDGFTGARYVKRRFSQDCPDVKILNNLEDTCIEAVRLARQKYNIQK